MGYYGLINNKVETPPSELSKTVPVETKKILMSQKQLQT